MCTGPAGSCCGMWLTSLGNAFTWRQVSRAGNFLSNFDSIFFEIILYIYIGGYDPDRSTWYRVTGEIEKSAQIVFTN